MQEDRSKKQLEEDGNAQWTGKSEIHILQATSKAKPSQVE